MKILLRNTQPLLGDRMMFTPAVRDLKLQFQDWKIGVKSFGPEIWENNPYIDRDVTEETADKIYDIGPGKVTKGSKTNGIHIVRSFLEGLSDKINAESAQQVKIKHGPFKPDIHLSDAEKNNKIVAGRYWVINIDTGVMTAKRWPAGRFQQLVASMPEINFIQVGLLKDNSYRLRGPNVINMIGQTSIREIFSLVYNSDGCISLVSSLMHIAAAFDKPCVVIAGGREPVTFEQYPNHRFLHTIGTMDCCRLQACWKNSIGACKNSDGQTPRCMEIIEVETVKEAIQSYYKGGILKSVKCKVKSEKLKVKPLIKIVANARFLGGAERSVIEIAKMFVKNNWRVDLVPAGDVCSDFERALPAEAVITNHITKPCDILLLYCSDMVFNFHTDKFKIFEHIQAKRKVMALTYKIGKTGEVPWTCGWDKYLFLSTALCRQFQEKVKSKNEKVKTAVLAPCVDIEPFLKISRQPTADSRQQINIVRHSSQGDNKFPDGLGSIMDRCPSAVFSYMPGPSLGYNCNNAQCVPFTKDINKVADFLAESNCFWYLLPDGYTDQGPRVIVEAMAAGLPVIAERRDGPADRVTPDTGWLINSHEQVIDIINTLTPEVLAEKGRAARERAIKEFRKEKWFDAIAGK